MTIKILTKEIKYNLIDGTDTQCLKIQKKLEARQWGRENLSLS